MYERPPLREYLDYSEAEMTRRGRVALFWYCAGLSMSFAFGVFVGIYAR